MADPVQPVTPAPAVPAATPAPAPVVAAPTTPTPAPTPEPVALPAVQPAVAAPAASESAPPATPAEAKPAEPPGPQPAAAVPTLLEDFDKEQAAKEAAKAKPPAPAAGATAAAAPGATGAPGATAAAAPVEPAVLAAQAPVAYEYKVPETMRMDDTLKSTVHKAFDDFRADPAKGAQGLIDLHEQQMKAYAQLVADEQQRVFRETRAGWRKDILADSEMGGAGHQTAMGAVARMRDLFVPEKDRPAFEQFLRVTGAGDHPAFLRLLHRAARFYDEPAVQEHHPRPPPNNGQRPSRRLRDIYDHPRSSADGRS